MCGLEPAHDTPRHGNQRAECTDHGLRFVFAVACGLERFPRDESLIPEPCAERGKYERKYGHVSLLCVVLSHVLTGLGCMAMPLMRKNHAGRWRPPFSGPLAQVPVDDVIVWQGPHEHGLGVTVPLPLKHGEQFLIPGYRALQRQQEAEAVAAVPDG